MWFTLDIYIFYILRFAVRATITASARLLRERGGRVLPAMFMTNGHYRRVAPFAVGSGRGLLADHIAGAQSARRQTLNLPPKLSLRHDESRRTQTVAGSFPDARTEMGSRSGEIE
jgi:hypothetical protein